MEHNPIDWPLCIKLAAGKENLAKDLLDEFMGQLSTAQQQINSAYDNDDTQLLALIHKLHGASCYCGVPSLKASAAALELALKTLANPELNDLMQSFNQASVALIQAYQKQTFFQLFSEDAVAVPKT